MHIRKKVSGTAVKPRVYVFKSNRYMNIGVADDELGKVLFGIRTEKGVKNMKKVAKDVATKLKKMKVEVAVFDRSGYKYHGAIAEFVDGLRANDIKI